MENRKTVNVLIIFWVKFSNEKTRELFEINPQHRNKRESDVLESQRTDEKLSAFPQRFLSVEFVAIVFP